MSLQGRRQADGAGQKYLNADCLRYLESLCLSARVTVEGAYTGRHRSPFKGHSQEFTDYREYYPGDSIRTIDWKVYARTDRYVIKLSEKETVMTCYLLVDSSASMAKRWVKSSSSFPTRTSSTCTNFSRWSFWSTRRLYSHPDIPPPGGRCSSFF